MIRFDLPTRPGLYALRVEPCCTCEGTGTIYNADWDIYWMLRERTTEDEARAEAFGIEYVGVPEEELPPEEEKCPECEGVGLIREWIPIKEEVINKPCSNDAQKQSDV